MTGPEPPAAAPDTLVARAKAFATGAHERIGHRRKYTQLPYDTHLENVANLVASVTEDPETIAAAWLHDVVEDTPATLRDIEIQFGRSVAELVDALTDISRPADGNRARRKEIDRMHLAGAPPRAKTVKLADLIDNARDISRHDPQFAQVYLREGRALLEVLQEGDASLLRLAGDTFDECDRMLRKTAGSDSKPAGKAERNIMDAVPPALTRLFMEAFSAGDVAWPLRSFDVSDTCAGVRPLLESQSVDVILLRRQGVTCGYAFTADLKGELCGEALKEFSPRQLLRSNEPLSEVIHVLTLHAYAFVSVLGNVSAGIRRADVNSPVFRMWLFGVITLLEMELARVIETRFPNESWRNSLSPARLEKTVAMQQERLRRNQPCRLAECLQFPDKMQLVLELPEALAALGFESKRTGKRISRELESLRNNLAHAQDITTHDWPQIARIAARMEEAAR